MIDRVSQAATLCRSHADLLAASTPTCRAVRDHNLAHALLDLPSSPLRAPVDRVLDVAEAICKGRVKASELRAFAGELDDQAAAEWAARWHLAAWGRS